MVKTSPLLIIPTHDTHLSLWRNAISSQNGELNKLNTRCKFLDQIWSAQRNIFASEKLDIKHSTAGFSVEKNKEKYNSKKRREKSWKQRNICFLNYRVKWKTRLKTNWSFFSKKWIILLGFKVISTIW